jgi:hypothetical protein
MDASSAATLSSAGGLGAGVVVVPVPDDGEPEDPEEPGELDDGVLPEPLDGETGAGAGGVTRGVALEDVDVLRGVAPRDELDGTLTFGSALDPVVVVVPVAGVVSAPAAGAAGGAGAAAGGAAATCAVDVADAAPGSSLSAA